MLNVSLGGQREGQDCFSLTETRAGTSVRRLEAQRVLVTFNKGLCQGGQDEEKKEESRNIIITSCLLNTDIESGGAVCRPDLSGEDEENQRRGNGPGA